METHGIEGDLEIQIDINLDHSRGFELNIVDNIGVGIGSSTSVRNISVNTSNSNNNNHLDDDDFNEYLRRNEKSVGNKVDFSLPDTPTDCLF